MAAGSKHAPRWVFHDRTIPENEDVASEVSEQLSQEVARLQLSDVLGVELKIEVQPLAAGRTRDPRNGRDAVPSTPTSSASSQS